MSENKMELFVNVLEDDCHDFDEDKNYCNTCGEECFSCEPHECSELVARLLDQIKKMRNSNNCGVLRITDERGHTRFNIEKCPPFTDCPCDKWEMKK